MTLQTLLTLLDKDSYGTIAGFWIASVILIIMIAKLIRCKWVRHTLIAALVIFGSFVTWFFRVPDRTVPQPGNQAIVASVADGRIVAVERDTESEYLKEECQRISIYMNFFDVHCNYWPVTGQIEYAKYHPGKHLMAFYPKASVLNEHSSAGILMDNGQHVFFKQMAGTFARRVVSYAKPGLEVRRGEQCGVIKFGSRIDIFLPLDAIAKVKVGDRVKAVESILAVLPSADTLASTDSAKVADCFWDWQTVASKGRGAELEAGRATLDLFGGSQTISIVRYPARNFSLSVVESDGEDAAATSSIAIASDALAAINGSYFNMKTFKPTTFVKDEGRIEGKTDESELYRCDGMLRIKNRRARKLDILSSLPDAYETDSDGWREAMVAGPVILEEGHKGGYDPQLKFNSARHPRSLMGYTSDGMVYLIVVDGRFPGTADGMSMDELYKLCSWLGLKEAINLDGGGSSTLWGRGVGVLNHPYDNHKFDHDGERKVPNVLVVR